MIDPDLFKLAVGGAIRIRNYDEAGCPELVEINEKVASRCKFLRLQYLGPTEEFPETHCAVFIDNKTGEVYGQPVEEPTQPETSAEPEAGAAGTSSATGDALFADSDVSECGLP